MNIKRTTRIATVAVIAVAGLGTGISAPAMASTPRTSSAMSLSNGPVKPIVRMSWSQCWRAAYFAARDEGGSVAVGEATADLTCGRSPDEY